MKKLTLSIIASSLLLVGCGSNSKEAVVATAAPATAVTVVNAKAIEHSPITHYIGRMQAMESANLVPRSSGHLKAKHFADGAMVNKGDLLFEIDATSYQAAVSAANASVKEASSAFKVAKLNLHRQTEMNKAGGSSQAQLDLAKAELEMAESRVSLARANRQVHQDNLQQTKVIAPYAGQLGKANFSIGDMVGPSFGPLTDLIMINPIEASFSLKESELSQFVLKGENKANVMLKINDSDEIINGELSFVDNKINANSGTITVGAVFDNHNNQLTTNQFVQIGLSDAAPLRGVKIPHVAIHQDQISQFVLTVKDNTVERQDVFVAQRIGQNVFISEGLAADETVIVGGLQRVRPGATVTVVEE
jgi:membrane fusion protein (multidrug efflux system)